MPRKARKLSSCGVYHIMIRGINRMTIFNDDADNLNFLHILDFCADENFITMAYCLMGNHLHLLAKDCNDSRSEERRVGKECRSRWSPYH